MLTANPSVDKLAFSTHRKCAMLNAIFHVYPSYSDGPKSKDFVFLCDSEIDSALSCRLMTVMLRGANCVRAV